MKGGSHMNLKKIINLLFFTILFTLFFSSNYKASAATDEQNLKINNTTLEFNKLIYVNETSGDDTNGNGSKEKPYKTFNVAYQQITNNNNEAIYLQKGNYTVSVSDAQLKKMSILGQGKDTTLYLNGPIRRIGNSDGVMYDITNIKFYRLIFKATKSGHNLFASNGCNFYNVAFNIEKQSTYSIFSSQTRPYFNNCIDIKGINGTIRGKAVLENCYGLFQPGYSTSEADIERITSIKEQANLDSEYHILSDGWKNAGTGTNPDGTVANIGVYGGPFAWEGSDNNPIPTPSALKVVLEVNEELQLSIDDDLNKNTEMIWNSSDNLVASVDVNGVVTALTPGNTVVTVTNLDGTYTDYINVLVVDDADELRLAIDLNIGKACRLTVDDLTETVKVTWTSMDPAVAAVSGKGKVTAISKGLTLITATDDQGKIIDQVYVRVRD